MIKQLLLLIIIILSFCSEVYSESECKLLARIDNDLWIIKSDGIPIQRLAFIGGMKATATWSPYEKYIAYGLSTPIGEEKAIIILDNTGQEITKIIVEPKESYWIRYIDRIVWRTPNILWSDSNVGPHGGFIDIWKLDPPTLRRHAKHEKRIKASNRDCEVSPNNKYMACIVRDNGKMYLEISDTDKKEYPDASYFHDRDPRTVDLKQMERVDKIRFTSDNANVIIVGADKKYKFNMLDNKLSEIKELPPDVTIKSIPEVVKIKKDEKVPNPVYSNG